MKKFFSLVLALVMALSLTTVAWGADVSTESALNAALSDGATITLTSDIALTNCIVISGIEVTINGNYTISHDDGDVFEIKNGGKLNLGAGLKVHSETDCAVWFSNPSNGALVSSANLSSNSTQYATITGNGSTPHTGTSITINGGSVTSAHSGAIYHPQTGTLTINGGTVSGYEAGIAMKSGTLTVAGGSVICTGPDSTPTTGYSNGINASGAAIQIESNDDYVGGVEVSITGGTVKSNNGAAIYEYVETSTADTAVDSVSVSGGTVAGKIMISSELAADDTVTVSGGTFTDNVIPYLANGSVYKDGVVTAQGSVPSTGTTSTGTVTSGTVTPVKPTLYALAPVGGSMTKVRDTFTSIKLTTVAGKIDADVVKYVPNIYNLDGDLYIEVAKADADYALYNNGAWIYLFDAPQTTDADVITAYATSVVMDAKVSPADEDIDCGDCLKGGQLATYYVSGDDVYYAGGYTWAYFNGEFVKYDKDTAVAFKGHVWDATTVTYRATDVKGHQVPVSVECKDCEKTFKVVYKTAFDNTWVNGVDYVNYPFTADYYIVLESATSAPVVTPSTDSDKVQSAETFDAGIAMYVGMSVMAAAGSVVVLKKRED